MSSAALSAWEPTISPLSGEFPTLRELFQPRRRGQPINTPSAAATDDAREVDTNFQRLDGEVRGLDEHLREFAVAASALSASSSDDMEIEVALRMPRTVSRSFKARLKPVATRSLVVGPSAREWEAIEAASAHDDR